VITFDSRIYYAVLLKRWGRHFVVTRVGTGRLYGTCRPDGTCRLDGTCRGSCDVSFQSCSTPEKRGPSPVPRLPRSVATSAVSCDLKSSFASLCHCFIVSDARFLNTCDQVEDSRYLLLKPAPWCVYPKSPPWLAEEEDTQDTHVAKGYPIGSPCRPFLARSILVLGPDPGRLWLGCVLCSVPPSASA
jgi:hypothetical protein